MSMGKLIDMLRIQLRDRDLQLWTDEALDACLQRAADTVAAITGEPYSTAADLASKHPTSRSILISGGIVHSLTLLIEEASLNDGTWVFRGKAIPPHHADVYAAIFPNVLSQYERSLEKLEVFGFIRAAKAS